MTNSSEKLYIKNMVCDRCSMVVRQELAKLGIEPLSVTLGEVQLAEQLNSEQRQQIRQSMQAVGFELIDDKRSKTIEQIKNAIIDLVHNNKRLNSNLSEYLATQIGRDYAYQSHLFSDIEGTTIEQYFIHQKIEKVKELLVYDELTLSQIAYSLDYSSVAHLSNQFKKVTGLTPSHFKKIGDKRRTPIDRV
ncbi:MAG TPA: AraC family transcriptional regulator [Chryseolinea sp.]|nr:AraC family transcriptional regulator [Chryseolinea sp.]